MTLRIGNCSGFYGDRLSAMRELLEGGPLDVLTGDYLAELTMLILGRDQLKDPALGYARTFVRQAEDCLGLALQRGVRIVSNAGGLHPAGLAERLREIGRGLDVIFFFDLDDATARTRAWRISVTGASCAFWCKETSLEATSRRSSEIRRGLSGAAACLRRESREASAERGLPAPWEKCSEAVTRRTSSPLTSTLAIWR